MGFCTVFLHHYSSLDAVRYCYYTSDEFLASSGFPPGSSLSPLLFLLFIKGVSFAIDNIKFQDDDDDDFKI